jgi:hypothetical protein
LSAVGAVAQLVAIVVLAPAAVVVVFLIKFLALRCKLHIPSQSAQVALLPAQVRSVVLAR